MTCTDIDGLIAACRADLDSDCARGILGDFFEELGDSETADWLRRPEAWKKRLWPMKPNKGFSLFNIGREDWREKYNTADELPRCLYACLREEIGGEPGRYKQYRSATDALDELFAALKRRAEEL